jgi:glycosyl transferase, family 25
MRPQDGRNSKRKTACRRDAARELGLSTKDSRGRRVSVVGTAAEERHSRMGRGTGQAVEYVARSRRHPVRRRARAHRTLRIGMNHPTIKGTLQSVIYQMPSPAECRNIVHEWNAALARCNIHRRVFIHVEEVFGMISMIGAPSARRFPAFNHWGQMIKPIIINCSPYVEESKGFMHVLEYFQQIYVINLPNRHDRRREMAEQLNSIGLSFDAPCVRLFEAVRPEAPGGFPSIGTRGCFLSHLGVLRHARDRQFERILIFEDDLNFAPDFNARICNVVAELEKTDWSLFYGGYVADSLPQPEGTGGVLRLSPADLLSTTHFIGFRFPAIGEAVTYLENILTRPPGDPNGGPMHVDGAYCRFRQQFPTKITLVSVPMLGYQRKSRTDIHSLRWFDRIPGIRQGVAWMRRRRNLAIDKSF